jgi:hypothetical protein
VSSVSDLATPDDIFTCDGFNETDKSFSSVGGYINDLRLDRNKCFTGGDNFKAKEIRILEMREEK